MEQKEYVTGFLINLLLDQIVLIKKTKPLWQAGRYNGVGGKIEANESPREAMVREFKEETGAMVPQWTEYAVLKNKENGAVIHYFVKNARVNLAALVKTTTEEEVVVRGLTNCLGNALSLETFSTPNVAWLIAMACTVADTVVEPHQVLRCEGWWKTS